jgi:thiol-disulfide isomerase/thioredoxin
MKTRKLLAALLSAMIVMSALLAAGAEMAPAAEPAPPMDSVIGAFSTVDIEGNPVSSDFFAESKLTMVNVWATFCGYCIDEMPDLARLDQEYEDLQVLGILGDAGTSELIDEKNLELGLEIATKTGATYTHVLPDSIIGEMLMQYIYSYPTSFFVDQQGQIVGKAIAGAMSYDNWKTVIDERMAQLP